MKICKIFTADNWPVVFCYWPKMVDRWFCGTLAIEFSFLCRQPERVKLFFMFTRDSSIHTYSGILDEYWRFLSLLVEEGYSGVRCKHAAVELRSTEKSGGQLCYKVINLHDRP